MTKRIAAVMVCAVVFAVSCAKKPKSVADVSAAGTYVGDLLETDAPSRTITLTLNPDQTASMSIDYRNGQPAVVQSGTWNAGSSQIDLALEHESLSFAREGETLILNDSEDAGYGEMGLTLTKSTVAHPVLSSPVGFVWQWMGTQTPVERIVPDDPTRYTLEFLPDTTVVAHIDCNRGHGKFTLDGKAITIGPLATTRMACPSGSLDSVFGKQLEAARVMFFQGDTLYLDLYADSGTMQFSQMPEPPKN